MSLKPRGLLEFVEMMQGHFVHLVNLQILIPGKCLADMEGEMNSFSIVKGWDYTSGEVLMNLLHFWVP
jgi:hypothetical protein